jgi:hypothetical protein
LHNPRLEEQAGRYSPSGDQIRTELDSPR